MNPIFSTKIATRAAIGLLNIIVFQKKGPRFQLVAKNRPGSFRSLINVLQNKKGSLSLVGSKEASFNPRSPGLKKRQESRSEMAKEPHAAPELQVADTCYRRINTRCV